MNRYIIHIAYLCLTFFLLASCNKQEDVAPQDEGMVNLSISAAMASRTTDTGDENRTYAELMHTLRIIIFDKDGNVEHNRLYNFEKGLFETENHIFIVKANETKTIYLLANCENFAVKEGDNPTIESLDALELKGDGILQAQGTKPDKGDGTINVLPATAKYSIKVGGQSQTETLYVVHAANKIQFEFINNTGGTINHHSWTLSSLAPESYLVPHVNEADWVTTLQAEENNVIYDYDVPVETNKHQEYTYTYNTPLAIPANTAEDSEDPVPTITPADNESPIYLHESKFLNLTTDGEDEKNDQSYAITFRISGSNLPDTETGGDGTGGTNDNTETNEGGGEESEAKPYTATLENLPSLFRGTYVKVKVTINALQTEDGPNGIYAEIEDWEKHPPKTGTIKPEESTESNP